MRITSNWSQVCHSVFTNFTLLMVDSRKLHRNHMDQSLTWFHLYRSTWRSFKLAPTLTTTPTTSCPGDRTPKADINGDLGLPESCGYRMSTLRCSSAWSKYRREIHQSIGDCEHLKIEKFVIFQIWLESYLAVARGQFVPRRGNQCLRWPPPLLYSARESRLRNSPWLSPYFEELYCKSLGNALSR